MFYEWWRSKSHRWSCLQTHTAWLQLRSITFIAPQQRHLFSLLLLITPLSPFHPPVHSPLHPSSSPTPLLTKDFKCAPKSIPCWCCLVKRSSSLPGVPTMMLPLKIKMNLSHLNPTKIIYLTLTHINILFQALLTNKRNHTQGNGVY